MAFPTVFDFSKTFRGLSLFIDGDYKGDPPLSVAVTPGRHTITMVERNTNTLNSQKVVNLDFDENINLSKLFVKNYTFYFSPEIKTGIYIPANRGFKNTYAIEMGIRYFSYSLNRKVKINAQLGISYMTIETKKDKNIYTDGEISLESAINLYSFPSALTLSYSPDFLINSRFRIGGFIAANYAELDRKLNGTGIYTSVSGLSNSDSDIYLGYGATGSYLYTLYKGFEISLNLAYVVNKPEFTIKDGLSVSNFNTTERTFDISGYYYGIGVRYRFE